MRKDAPRHIKDFDAKKFMRAVRSGACVLLSASLALMMTGCKDEPVVSDTKKERVVVHVEDCKVDDDASQAMLDGEIGDTEANAKKTYFVLKEKGLSNEMIAGVLGNWSTESGIDPSGIETIYDEHFQMGPKKQAAMADLDSFTQNKVFPAYANATFSINRGAYKGDDGKYYCGLGLGQFTGPGAYRLIKYSEKHGQPWYSFDLQMAYTLDTSAEGYGRKEFWDNWTSSDSPEAAAEHFLAKWEGCPGMMLSQRQTAAREWYGKMGDWGSDSSYANSIINMIDGKASAAKKPTAKTASGNSKPTADGGTKIDIPDEFDSIQQNYGYGSDWQILIDGVQCSTGWVEWGKEGNGGAAGEQARKWVKDGSHYATDQKDLVVIDDRIGCVVKETFGKSGDYIDVVYKDGKVLHGVIIDNQGATDDTGPGGCNVDWAKYGHNVSGGKCNVLEWYSDGPAESHLWKSGQNPCSIPGFEYITGVVDYIINTNGVNTGSALDGAGVSDEECDKAQGENGVDVAPGEAAAVEDSLSAKIEWLYGAAGLPKNWEESKSYFETFDVVIRNTDGSKGTMSIEMHKKLKTEVQAIFQDIYNNTDYKINPGDCNTTQRGWATVGTSGNISHHSYGLAIDINVSHNAGDYTSCGTWNPGSDPLSIGKDHKVVEIMKKHGFGWGGNFSKNDPMHFSYTGH